MLRIIATRPAVFRDVFVIKGHTIIVIDEPDLIENTDYAPGVMDGLQEAWSEDDYFYVMKVFSDSTWVGVSGMAGYGGPEKAAKAFVRDFIVLGE